MRFCYLLILSLCLPLAVRAESTAHMDMRLLLEHSWQDVYRKDDVQAMFKSQLQTKLSPQEEEGIRSRIQKRALEGFRAGKGQQCLLSAGNEDIRKLIQSSPYGLDEEFVVKLYEEYKNSPTSYDLRLLSADGWKKEKLTTAKTYKALEELLAKQAQRDKVADYFKVLHHGYVTHLQARKSLDDDVNKRFVQGNKLSPPTIVSIHRALASSLWNSQRQRRDKMVSTLAKRTYAELPAHQWAKLPKDVLFSLARKVGLAKWLKKAALAAKQDVHNGSLRRLLALLIGAPELSRKKSFAIMRPLFVDDEAFFTALHQTPPAYPVMKYFIAQESFRPTCLKTMLAFFPAGKERKWSAKLWNIMVRDYYVPYHSCAHLIYGKKMAALAADSPLKDLSIRQKLLTLVQEGRTILPRHRYEIVTKMLQSRPMTEMVQLKGEQQELLQYALKVYYAISPTDSSIYGSKTLGAKLHNLGLPIPRKTGTIVSYYVRFVLAPPCGLLCSAFIGNKSETKGVIFSLSDRLRLRQLEELLGKIAALKARLRTAYKMKLPRLPQLKAVNDKVAQELEKALLKRDKMRAMGLITLTLKIAALLDDDTHIERLISLLRKEVFGIGAKDNLYQKVSSVQLAERIEAFNALHGEPLFHALQSIGKLRYAKLFYRKLYIPLRSIDGFFKKVGAKPYVRFIDELSGEKGHYDKSEDLLQLHKLELESFKIVNKAGNACYIDAEDAVIKLFYHYHEKRSKSCWATLEAKLLNVNFNLGVVQMLLKNEAKTSSHHLLQVHSSYSVRAKRYYALAKMFLDNLAPAKGFVHKAGGGFYEAKDFHSLLSSLLILHEVHGWPLPSFSPSELYEGNPSTKLSLRHLTIGKQGARRKISGKLRSLVFKVLSRNPKVTRDKEYWKKLVTLTLLLPNNKLNAKGGPKALNAYFKLKSTAFSKTKKLLKMAKTSKERLQWLSWLCYLECSVFGLSNNKGFGYEQVRRHFVGAKALGRLKPADVKTLLFEEFRLKEINQSEKIKSKAPVQLLLATIRELLCSLTKEYALVGKEYDDMSQAAVDYMKQTTASKVLEELRPEHLAHLFYLTATCRSLMIELTIRPPAQKGTKELKEERAALALGKELFTLYAYFLPYVHGEFNVSTLLSHKWALPLFSMIDRGIKRPLVALIEREHNRKRKANGSLLTFLVCHNFLPISLLQASLDNPQVFVSLAQGRELTLKTWNFHLPWLCEDKVEVGLDSLCDEVLDGITMNRDVLPLETAWEDGDYLEYLFGDMRQLFSVSKKSKLPQNFDQTIRALACLVDDPRYKNLLSGLEQGLKLARTAQQRKRLRLSLSSAKTFPQKIRLVLSDGYPYLGRLIAERMENPQVIQYLCERAYFQVQEGPKHLPQRAASLYGNFYESACCKENSISPLILQAWTRTFYDRQGKKEKLLAYHGRKRKEFKQAIDGASFEAHSMASSKSYATFGLRHFLDSNKKDSFTKSWQKGAKEQLHNIFQGRGLKANQPFIGDLVWQDGKIAPLPFDKKPEQCRQLVEWIFWLGEHYGDVPQLRDLFLAGGLQ